MSRKKTPAEPIVEKESKKRQPATATRKKPSKKKATADPFAVREAQKYDNPIASREYILALYKEQKTLLGFKELAELLHLSSDEHLEALRRRLRAMERDGQLMRTRKARYGLPDKMNLLAGKIVGHRDGFGFFYPDNGSDTLFLPEREMRGVFHGDRVLVRLTGYTQRGKQEAAIVEVLERNTQQVVGRYFEEKGVGLVIPDNRHITHDILVPPDGKGDAKPGQIVVATIVTQPAKHVAPIGTIHEVLGDHLAPGMEIDVAIRAHNLPYQWSLDVMNEIEKIPTKVLPSEKTECEDLREFPFVTIDGDDAKDFDDAVYCEPMESGGWQLYVAIADVSHYVKPNSAIDQQAKERGNSVYFPGRVIPMLPSELSDELCSLKPRVDRLSLVCKMSLTAKGKVRSYRFMNAVIRSHARMTYTNVAKILIENNKTLKLQYKPLIPHLESLYALFQVLLKQRHLRGAIDFEFPETKFIFGKDRKISKIVPSHRNDAHRLIEECMLLANVSAANYLIKHEINALFRIHASPDKQKIIDLRAFLAELGLGLGGGEDPTAMDYAHLMQRIQGREDIQLIQMVLLRSLSQAIYHPDNVGHFGLAYESYTHFTSPIRRYPDLLTHRAIKYLINKKKDEMFIYDEKEMYAFGEHCSYTERRADEATRDVNDWLKCEYMLDKIGQEFKGTIASVTGFGFFVSLNDVFVEGLVHISALTNDYYQFDSARHRLTGESSGMTYRVGDPVDVRVARVALDDRKIDFELIFPLKKEKSAPAKKKTKQK